ncbi:MAG: hypothetical protein DRN95_09215 [Candidatus Hydrothermarchaeota archaeon]|nr:MAG: hypothetical protein DRN95_09215 [Candidatus Hydrothermarchaeota archaeon]
MRIYRITTRHSQLTDVSTPHTPSDVQGIGTNVNIPVWAYTQIIQGTWVLAPAGASGTNQDFHGFIHNTSNTNGDEIHYQVYLSTGTWKLIMLVVKFSDAGITDVYIDNTKIATFDLYNSTEQLNTIVSQDNISISQDGLKTLKFKLNGHNANSGGYKLDIYGICFMRTA